MLARNFRSWQGIRESIGEAISAVGWERLLVWSAAGSAAVAVATNTFWLLIETLVPPSMARGLELLPYFAGMFVATVVGQLLGPYAGLRRELQKLEAAHRAWFDANNPLAELNHFLWNMGTEAESSSFRSLVCGRTDDYAEHYLDEGRTRLLTTVSRNLESVPKLFHVPGVSRSDVAEFGSAPSGEVLVSLARGLREAAGWGQVELRPTWEWLVYSPLSIVGGLLLLFVMVVLLTLMPVSGLGTDGPGFFFSALAVQWPLYLVSVAFFMLLSAGRPSGIVQAALPTGLRTGNLVEALALANDPFERIRLSLGSLPPDDRKALLEATHYALWKAARAYKTASRARTSHRQRPSGLD